jgi:hypothetical protein
VNGYNFSSGTSSGGNAYVRPTGQGSATKTRELRAFVANGSSIAAYFEVPILGSGVLSFDYVTTVTTVSVGFDVVGYTEEL